MRLLLVLLAALLAIGNAQHVNFRRMSSTGTDAGVKADTGYATPVIGYLWRKYRTQLINRVRGYEGFRIVGNAGEKALAVVRTWPSACSTSTVEGIAAES